MSEIKEGIGMTMEEVKDFIMSDTPENIARKFPHDFIQLLHYKFTGEIVDYNTGTLEIVNKIRQRAELMENNPNRVDRDKARKMYLEIGEFLETTKSALQTEVSNPDFVEDREDSLNHFLLALNSLTVWIEEITEEATDLFATEDEEIGLEVGEDK